MDNSFASVHPELVCEWSDKNAPLTPAQITYGSKKLYWWKGPCGHEWKASARSRSSGEKCPYCAGMRVLPGYNDLASKRPELVKEWSSKNKLKPTEVHWSSHKKAVWRDKFGHEWEAVIKNRVYGSGCPYCSHNKILEGFNDLASVCPEVAAEWSDRNLPLTPNKVTAFSNKKVWWKCHTCGYEWKAVVFSRVHGSKCPVCTERSVMPGYNDLQTTDPELMSEWDFEKNQISPTQVSH